MRDRKVGRPNTLGDGGNINATVMARHIQFLNSQKNRSETVREALDLLMEKKGVPTNE